MDLEEGYLCEAAILFACWPQVWAPRLALVVSVARLTTYPSPLLSTRTKTNAGSTAAQRKDACCGSGKMQTLLALGHTVGT